MSGSYALRTRPPTICTQQVHGNAEETSGRGSTASFSPSPAAKYVALEGLHELARSRLTCKVRGLGLATARRGGGSAPRGLISEAGVNFSRRLLSHNGSCRNLRSLSPPRHARLAAVTARADSRSPRLSLQSPPRTTLAFFAGFAGSLSAAIFFRASRRLYAQKTQLKRQDETIQKAQVFGRRNHGAL